MTLIDTPALRSREASPIIEQEYAPKIRDPQPDSDRERVAIIVNHGMGQQVPYETMESVALAVLRGIGLQDYEPTQPVVRIVRLGTEGKDDIETELVRVEIQVPHRERLFDVHIYESYWAPLTEGKVALKDVISFLWQAGFNGLRNTESGTFKRWLFGSVRRFKLHRIGLFAALLGTMCALASLIFINSVLMAAAVSHAIAGNGSFPSPGLIAPLTSDFIVADLGAISIFLGTVVPYWIKQKRTLSLAQRWLIDLEWGLVILGILVIVFAGGVMPWQLVGFHPEHHLWRYFSDFAGCLNRGASACPAFNNSYGYFVMSHPQIGATLSYTLACRFGIVMLWGTELLAALAVRWFLIEFVGDVAAYIAAHTVSKFWELRQQIWQTAMKVARAVYRAKINTPAAGNDSFLYNKVVVVGHSLGSVIAYDVLNGLLLEDGFSRQPLHIAARTRMFLTFGSPLDKTAFLFKTQRDMNSPVRTVGAAAVQPMVQNYSNRPADWVNLWSPSDPISGNLDFYDPPTLENAKEEADAMASGSGAFQCGKGINNRIDPGATTPFAAHVEYWSGSLFAQELIRGITT